MKRRQKGFSLIELLIVVAIILIVATIAIPSLVRSRQSAHESAAVATLKLINTAETNLNVIGLPLSAVGPAPQDALSIVQLSLSSLKKWLPPAIRTRLSLINHAFRLTTIR